MNSSNDSPQRSYWLIEPEELAELPTINSLQPFTRVLLSWVAGRVKDALALEDQGIHLTVIEAEYMGKYPCLAAYSSQRDGNGFSIISDVLAARILDEIRRTLRETSVTDLLGQLRWSDGNTIDEPTSGAQPPSE